jgi:hypothetical protein
MITEDILNSIVTGFKLTKGTKHKVVMNGETFTAKKFVEVNVSSLLSIDSIRNLLTKSSLIDIQSAISAKLVEWSSPKEQEFLTFDELQAETEEQRDYLPLRPFLNSNTGDIELMDIERGGISKIHIKAWLKVFRIPLKTVENSLETLFPIYRPDIKDIVFNSDSIDIKGRALNTYSPPNWKIDGLGQAKMPLLLEKFFMHLFPVEESRLTMFHHLYFMLTSRSQVLLCLAGRQAIGKSIFAETLVKAMIGRSNWAKAPRSFTKKEFNGFLKNRKAVVVEEIPLAASREERIATNEMLKDILNDTVTIEEKGQDSFTTQNYVTVFVTTNSPKAIPLVDLTDRRFLCLDITKTQLRRSMTQKEIERLKDLNENSQEIADFCHWILEHGKIKDKDAFYCFTNELKKKIYFLTLSSWEIGLLEWIDAVKADYTFGIPMELVTKEAKKNNSGKVVKLSTVEEFLNKHQLSSGNYIGEIDGGRLVLNEEALKTNVSDNVKEIKKDIFGDNEDDEFDSFLENPKESSL